MQNLAVGEAERRATAATVTLGAVQFGELLEALLYSLVGALGILCVVFRGIGSGIVWAAHQATELRTNGLARSIRRNLLPVILWTIAATIAIQLLIRIGLGF